MAFTIREQRPADASDESEIGARPYRYIESESLPLLIASPPEAVRMVGEGASLQVTHG